MMRLALLLLALLALPARADVLTDGTLTAPSLTCNQTSGPAPLHVICKPSTWDFDSAQTEEFHSITAVWQYGEPAMGTWSTSGRDRNLDVDYPIGGAVYETPGTFTMRTHWFNNVSDHVWRDTTITVDAPDAHWPPSTDTRCVCDTSNFTGCPSGVPGGEQDVYTGTDWNSTVWLTAGKRTLYCAGGVFAQSTGFGGALPTGTASDRVLIGKYGSGADPVVNVAAVANPTSMIFNNGGSYTTLDSIDFVGDLVTEDIGNTTRVWQMDTGLTSSIENLLWLDVDVDGFENPIYMNPAATPAAQPMGSGFVRYTYVGPNTQQTAFESNSRMHLERAFKMGTQAAPRGRRRIMAHTDSLFADGLYTAESNAAMDFRACEPSVGNLCATDGSSHQVVVSDNVIYSGDSYIIRMSPDWNLDPSDTGDGRDIYDFLFSRNLLKNGASGSTPLNIRSAGKTTLRNNVFHLLNSPSEIILRSTTQTDGSPVVDNWRVYGNTILREGGATSLYACSGTCGSGHEARSNLADVTAGAMTFTTGTDSNNVEVSSDPISGGRPNEATSVLADYQVAFPNASIDDLGYAAGARTDMTLLLDAFDHCRSATPDVGHDEEGTDQTCIPYASVGGGGMQGGGFSGGGISSLEPPALAP